MKKNNYYKSLKAGLFLLTALMLSLVSFSQTQSILTLTGLSPSQLNSNQSALYNKLATSAVHDNFQIVQVQNLSQSQVSGKIRLALSYLPCNDIIFTATKVEYTSENDYYWYGIIDSEEEEYPCHGGSITLMAKGGEKFGAVVFDEYSYEFQDIGGGLQVFARYKLEVANENECGVSDPGYRQAPPSENTEDNPPGNTGTGGRITPCQFTTTDEVRVLVLWTQAAANAEANINNRIALAIAQTNQAYLNSQVGGTLNLVLAGSQLLNFTETASITNDVNTLGGRADVQALRNALQADLVILLTNGGYGGTFGIVRAIGPNFANAYSIVQTNAATGGRFTFAHEVGHLFGARHDIDPNGTIQHGYTFRTGGFLGLFTKKRYTLLAVMEAGKTREQNYSNPDVRIKNKPTGTVNFNNNAQQHRNTAAAVANFFANPPTSGPMAIDIIQDNPNVCCTFVTAEADVYCGAPPYYFNWLISYDGINWQLLPNSEFVSFSTACDQSILMIELAVTDANGQFRTVRKYYNADCGQTVRTVQTTAVAAPGIKSSDPAPKIVQQIFPNPARSFVQAEILLPVSTGVKVEVLDAMGNVRRQVNAGKRQEGKNIIQINTAGLPAGLYRLRVNAGNITEAQQFLIEN